MNLFNSVKTRKVSKKTYAPFTRESVRTPDGKLVFRELDNSPIIGNAEDFSIENQFKTGVRFDAPQGDFFKENRLVISDIVREGGEYLLRVTPEASTETPDVSTETPDASTEISES